MINSNGGPAARSNPYAKMAGIITSADSNAASVSKITVLTAEKGISASRLR